MLDDPLDPANFPVDIDDDLRWNYEKVNYEKKKISYFDIIGIVFFSMVFLGIGIGGAIAAWLIFNNISSLFLAIISSMIPALISIGFIGVAAVAIINGIILFFGTLI